ncbi:hypothetical protein TNCV_1716651 [Trichonephila clavipes]|nr:hypothetical protein TNCV_1716651 [Trichonephila clavipes]
MGNSIILRQSCDSRWEAKIDSVKAVYAQFEQTCYNLEEFINVNDYTQWYLKLKFLDSIQEKPIILFNTLQQFLNVLLAVQSWEKRVSTAEEMPGPVFGNRIVDLELIVEAFAQLCCPKCFAEKVELFEDSDMDCAPILH